jgi:hypothetical protein
MSALSHRLRWDEVDPVAHPFDGKGLRELIDRALAPYAPLSEGDSEHRDLAEEAVTRALTAEYGAWPMCWNWAASEPGGGGPVRSWCCGDHSFDVDGATARERVETAVVEWRHVLESLAAEFSSLHRECAGLSDGDAAMRAAARLLPRILEWTDSQDAWYATFATILAWFLEPRLKDANRTQDLVLDAISGLFNSWVAPSPDEQAKGIESVGRTIDADSGITATADALADWRTTRRYLRWIPASAPLRRREPRDGHLAFIEAHDRRRDPRRAERMKEALAVARASATRGDSLTGARLQTWQRIVLGSGDAAFRSSDAFAKRGGERYGMPPEGWSAFEACLEQADEDEPHVVARAVRAYLDVCFFHPFADGNGRAGRLACDFVLTRAGLALHSAEPVFLLSRLANDWAGAYAMQAVVESLVGRLPRESAS